MSDSAATPSSHFLELMKTPQRVLRIGLAFAFLLLGAAADASGQTATKRAVPVYREARHHLVFENALVRVLDVRVPAGDTTDFHVHANRHIAVVIADARTWDQSEREATPQSASAPMPTGTVFDNGDHALPYTHRVANVDTVGFRYIVAQLLAPSGVASANLASSSGLRLDHEVFGARIYRVTIAPGRSMPTHRHAPPGLTVQANAGTLRVDGAKPEGKSDASGAGAWWWRGAGTEHTLRNSGTTTVEVVEIDWP